MHRHGATKKVVLVLAASVRFVMASYGRGCWGANAGDLWRYGGVGSGGAGSGMHTICSSEGIRRARHKTRGHMQKGKNKSEEPIESNSPLAICRAGEFLFITVCDRTTKSYCSVSEVVVWWCYLLALSSSSRIHTSLSFSFTDGRYLRVQYC